uniref:MBL fold metallo-hydrolase n=1 Tax=Phocaeicola sp. TaxID=2773926 RepID=UPI003A942DCE
MKLIYLYHSGFALLGEGYTLILDYFEDSVSAEKGIVHEELLSREGRLYVLSSHAHADHFNRQILSWKALRPDIVYLLSADIPLSARDKENGNFHTLTKGDTYRDEYLTVRAFGSTDIGISFLVQTPEGTTVFHAGDLNNWHWMDESPEEEWKRDEAFFLRELEDIAACIKKMDVVLFPVDPRLGKEYMRGPLQFVKRIKTAIFVPMHFDEAFEKAAAFAPLAASEGTQVLTPARRGQTLNLETTISI